jgi:hypothetical protein
VHIDAYLKKNAFLDYLVPTGYLIQVTPDIGWHNILSMFDSSESLPNPHIKTLGPYQVDLGNLTDNLDNTVTAIIDESDFRQAITTTFEKYYWRAVPVTANGQVGIGGLPVRFNYIGTKINELFSIDEIIQDDLSNLKVIIGSKAKNMRVVIDDNENYPNITYPTETTWKIEIVLSGPSRTLKIYAKDAGGSVSSTTYVELVSKLFTQNSVALWNTFDEHGLVADLERLPNESNYKYSNRIKDVYRNKGGSTFIGIVNGATRELGLNKVPNALEIKINRDSNNLPIVTSATVVVTSFSLRLQLPYFEMTERLMVDPIYGTIDLTYLPVDIPIFSYIEGVGKIDYNKIEIVPCCEDTEYKYQLRINSDLALGRFVEVKYKYYKEFLFKRYSTIGDILTAINQIVDPSGTRPITCYISSLLSGNEDSLGLFIGTYTSISIPWAPIFIKRISDRGYRDYFITNGQTIRETEYYSYIRELKNNTRIFWGAVEADRDRWDSADQKQLSMDSIPTLFDPPITKMLSIRTGQSVRMEAVTAWARNYIGFNNEYLVNIGLSSDLFHPGVAYTSDLKPDLYITTSRLDIEDSSESNIGIVKNDNNFVVFSGQI